MINKRITALLSAVSMMSAMLVPIEVSFAEETVLSVGEDKEYKTIHEAVAEAKKLNPEDESSRVIINIDPGTYEEQVIFDNMKYVTLQQAPDTEGRVNLNWYYCTGYAASNADLNGSYNPEIDWTADSTWTGPDGDDNLTRYSVGQKINSGTTITYYDLNGEKHTETTTKDMFLGETGGLDKMAALVVRNKSENITVKDLNIVNSVPVMVTQGQKDAHLTPCEDHPDSPERYSDALTVAAEDTPEVKPTADIYDDNGQVNIDKYRAAIESGTVFSEGESVWLARSGVFNERGHAVSVYDGDKITFDSIRIRGGQDSLFAAGGRILFNECDIIGGTDYIYGGATAVFNNCTLGLEGFSDRVYGSPIATPSTPASRKYGYLFFNCTIYNVRDNGGVSNFGGPWGAAGQATYYNTVLDDNGTVGKSGLVIDPAGWCRFGAQDGKGRLYEYGTVNISGAPVDLSQRVVNLPQEEGGTGMGTVLNQWQILEFNPRNYFAAEYGGWTDDWDPINFAEEYLSQVDTEISNAAINVPEGEETVINLPSPSDSNVEFHWVSTSANAVVSADEKTITVIRPAFGEEPIESSVVLYARDKTSGYGDKKEIPVTIASTTNTEDVFDIPVTIKQSTNAENTYTITVRKNGALIKKQEITIEKGSSEISDVVRNIPASAEGIEYDIQVVSESDDFTVTVPDGGKTVINGVTGNNVQLDITSQKLADEKITTDISFTPSNNEYQSYDLIALAKEKGASNDVETSDVITVEYDFVTSAKPSAGGYINLTSQVPGASCVTGADAGRFVLTRIQNSWEQLDMVDNSAGFEGTQNIAGVQWLNIAGKFDYENRTPSHVAVTINYKTQTITAQAKGSGNRQNVTSFDFEHFPETAEKGKLYLAVYPQGADVYNISNVSVTYKKVITGDEPEIIIPEGEGIYAFAGNNNDIIGGNLCDNNETLVFVDGADKNVTKFFADDEDDSIIKPELVANYKNYVAGTGSNGSHPQIVLNAPAGKYRIYYLGFNHGNNITAEVGGEVYTAEAGVDFAYKKDNTADILKVYAIDIEMANSGETITFDSTDQWLPDLYAIVVVGTSELAPSIKPTPEVTEQPTAEPTPEATEQPTAEPTPEATEQPTAEPTPEVTEQPVTDKMILSAEKANGSTVVKLANITGGAAVAAKYENGRFTAMRVEEVNGDTVIFEDFEADKVFVWDSLTAMTPVCPAKTVAAASPTTEPTQIPVPPSENPVLDKAVVIDFTSMDEVPVYTQASGQGFVSESDAIMPEGYERETASVDKITLSTDGAFVTESDGVYLHSKTNTDDGDDYNYGGLIYRIDTGKAGAYRLEVEVTGTSSDTRVAPTGMDAGRLTGTSNWDNANMVPRTVSAAWSNNTWSYDFATGEDFIEIEIEPSKLPTKAEPQTVGVKKITIAPLEINEREDKPTIHILGDSTQKTYTFNETISSWGQTLGNYFDKNKVNVVNYSMGGRAMKSNYNEGRFDEILIKGKQGDFVFIHSAHNDETVSTNRFSRGAGTVKDDLAVNNENYNKWLDMYVEAIKARGMIPVLVTAMPRVGSGKYSESALKPNGFNPDSPGNMRTKAASDSEVGLVELYDGAKEYIDSLDSKEVSYIYNMIEAGETPANNSANGANSDGTHYREAAAKQWCRIMLQSIYDQSEASNDIYTDKGIMKELVSYMADGVADAAATGDWSDVFPEMASDVSAVGVVPDAHKQSEENYYYRTSIEKALQLGLLCKDSSNLFKPTQTITVGDFARGIEKAFGLQENSLVNYNKTYAELNESPALETANNMQTDVILLNETSGDEAGEGTTAVTVEQTEGGTVTVYNESAYRTSTVDIKGDETSLEQIADNDYFTLTAPGTVKCGTDKSGVFAENAEVSTSYIETAMTSSIKDKFITYTAKQSGIVTMYMRFVGNKTISCENIETGEKVQTYINNAIAAGSSDNTYGTVNFSVEEGNAYRLYSDGGTSRIFGIQYASTDYPQSTSKLYAGEGDLIRVSAVANEGYVNGSIIVNGEAVSSSKEYTFILEGDTKVTANFEQEPAMVENTVVASDAALTREIMGAVLYDAYQLADKTIMSQYMSQNGGVPSPDDPNYDPNIQYEGSPYIPLTGWGALTDKDELSNDFYAKVKAAYNLGLIRPETDIARGSIALGTELEPKAEVTRAKAAKTLVFAFMLTQPLNGESQTLPDGINHAAETAEIAVPNPNAPSAVFK